VKSEEKGDLAFRLLIGFHKTDSENSAEMMIGIGQKVKKRVKPPAGRGNNGPISGFERSNVPISG
jgi:hypothetical protein